jgi:predicted glycoside hydrolase/deacetylase ChbG (UPF0249 family)
MEKTTQRYLIINADDLGVCEETNKAIEHIFDEGTISSTTMMTPCPGAKDAVDRVINNSKLKTGLHITTTAEWSVEFMKWPPVAPIDKVSSLVHSDGYFYGTVADFAKHAVADEVVIEMESQLSFLTSRGITPTHADSHMGSVYGFQVQSFLKEALEFCARYQLPFRFPKNIASVMDFMKIKTLPDELLIMHSQAVGYAAALGVPLIDNLYSNALPFEELSDYADLKRSYFDIITNLPEGVSEIFMHPSTANSPLAKYYPKWQMRVWEYQLCLDDEFRKHIEKEGIKLISYPDIVKL